MSNAGNLFNKDYTKAVVGLGEGKGMEELVVGFIAQSRVSQVTIYLPKHKNLKSKWLQYSRFVFQINKKGTNKEGVQVKLK